MRTRLAFVKHRIGLALAKGAASTPIIVSWTEITGTTDPVSGSVMGTGGRKQLQTGAFVHFVQIATTDVRQFNEVQVGDCIVDLAADLELTGKTDLRFTISDEEWVPKKLSNALGVTWDVLARGQRFCRSLLLRKAT